MRCGLPGSNHNLGEFMKTIFVTLALLFTAPAFAQNPYPVCGAEVAHELNGAVYIVAPTLRVNSTDGASAFVKIAKIGPHIQNKELGNKLCQLCQWGSVGTEVQLQQAFDDIIALVDEEGNLKRISRRNPDTHYYGIDSITCSN